MEGRSFAPVASVAFHRRMHQDGVLGKYLLLLAHKILRDVEAARFYQQWKRQTGGFIIMDNSVVELEEPLPTREILRAAEMVNADVLVLPDSLKEPDETLEMSIRAADEIIPAFWEEGKEPHLKLMVVVQGKTFHDVRWFVESIRKAIPEEWLWGFGVPRAWVEAIGTRWPIVSKVAEMTNLPIHLLGFSDRLEDDLTCARMKNVVGIDSAVPIRLALNGVKIDDYIQQGSPPLARRGQRYLSLGEDAYDRYADLIQYNVKWVRYAIGRG